MELPPYRMPTARSVLQHMAERSWLYVRKAGTVILGISIVMWAMATFPTLDPETVAAETGGRVVKLLGDGVGGLPRLLKLRIQTVAFALRCVKLLREVVAFRRDLVGVRFQATLFLYRRGQPNR